MKKIRAGIVGGAGYTGGELIRLLLNHNEVEIVFVQSKSNFGKYIYEVHTDLLGDTNLIFSQTLSDEIDVLFLCLAHGDSVKFLNENILNQQIKIIDLSQDFRIDAKHSNNTRKFVYGLPELNRDQILEASNIANPGCFATCIQLALLPAADLVLLHSEINISATTGSTGA